MFSRLTGVTASAVFTGLQLACEIVQLWHALQGMWTYVKNGVPAYAAVISAMGFSHAWTYN